MRDPRSMMIIAGEVSGDMHAANLLRELRQREPELVCYGIGGDNLRAAGVELFHDVKDMAVMGLSEVLRRYGFFRRVFHEMLEVVRERKPDAVLLIDYPGFNLRFAKRLHAMGIKVVYYICPQVWAWNRGRIPAMAETLDRLITIFPFEAQHFEGTGLTVDFAGHPLVAEAQEALAAPAADLPWEGNPRIALLPGSRQHEIERILPVMWSATEWIERQHPGASFIIPVPTKRQEACVMEKLAYLPDGPTRCELVVGQTRQVLRSARAALVASGTATIETALMGCPMVVVYRVGLLTYLLGKLLVKVDNIGMVNIVAGKTICPEFIQGQAHPKAISEAILPLIDDSPQRTMMLGDLKVVAESLGPANAAARAADSVLAVFSS